jgi:hypothetical protein
MSTKMDIARRLDWLWIRQAELGSHQRSCMLGGFVRSAAVDAEIVANSAEIVALVCGVAR